MKAILKMISFIIGISAVFLIVSFCKWSIDPSTWGVADRCASAFLGVIVGGMVAFYPKC